jgi:hypothetical protein
LAESSALCVGALQDQSESRSQDHRRALGLVTCVRMLIGFRAGLDRWCEYGYGTCSLPVHEAREGALNALLGIGADRVAPNIGAPQLLPAPVMARLREAL